MTAVAYLRKSRSDDPTKEVSEDVQRQAVEAMAARDGVTISHWYKDWDRSADESKVARRTDYAAMLKAIERCEVETIYAYSVDRLYRSLTGYMRLSDAAKRCGARIVVPAGVVGGDGSPMADAFASISAVFTQLELSTAKARAKAAYAAREARGDYVGQIPYGYRLVKVDGRNVLDPPGLERVPDGTGGRVLRRVSGTPPPVVQPILDAYVRSGKRVRSAARILNDELHLAAPYGHEAGWDRSSLLRVLEREAPDLLPARTASGRRDNPATPALLSKLLRCHCGRLLTPNRKVEKRTREPSSAVNYYCSVGNSRRSDHPRVYVAESFVLPFVKAEAARLRPPTDTPSDEDNAARRAQLNEQLRRLTLAFTLGEAESGLSELDYHRQRKPILAEVKRLDDASRPMPVPGGIDWDYLTVSPETAAQATADVNAALRGIFAHIQLDTMLRPTEALWLVPEWRGD